MLRYSARTDPGNREGDNEDAVGCDAARQVWLVADGMGGHGNGTVASQLAKSALLGRAGSGDLPGAIQAAHESIVAAVARDASLRDMGSTIVVAEIAARRCKVAWVGDSRAYLLRDGALTQLTTDHSYVEMLRQKGGHSEAQLRIHPKGHLITRGLGMRDPVASAIETPLQTGDWIILCSDGLTDELTDPEIAAVLGPLASVDAAADALVAGALSRGGSDNVSAIVIEYDGADFRQPWLGIRQQGLLWSVGSGVASALAVIALWWWFAHRQG